MELTVTTEERDELIHIISRYQNELRIEVRRTDNRKLKNELKTEQEIVDRVLGRISEAA